MQVSRDSENRLSGTVSSAAGQEPHGFSGILELLKVLEDLVPAAMPGIQHPPTA
jgi:hypothetical protein